MTRTELSQKICEGIAAVFGRKAPDPANWLYEQDFNRGYVCITESVSRIGGAVATCRNLEKAMGPGFSVTSSARSGDAFAFTISFNQMKNEAKYTDGEKTLSTIEQDGKTVLTDGTPEGTLAVTDPDKFIDGLNKVTGSRFRKAEDVLEDCIKEANLALTDTGYAIEPKESELRITGDSKVLAPICDMLPYGDEYSGSGFDKDASAIIVVIPPEIFGVEELTGFIDNAVASILDAIERPEEPAELGIEDWCKEINAAEPDERMARRFSYLRNAEGLSLALTDEKFAQAVSSVRSLYGNDKAEAVLTMRLGAEKARGVIEALGPMADAPKHKAGVLESIVDTSHNEIVGRRRDASAISPNLTSERY